MLTTGAPVVRVRTGCFVGACFGFFFFVGEEVGFLVGRYTGGFVLLNDGLEVGVAGTTVVSSSL